MSRFSRILLIICSSFITAVSVAETQTQLNAIERYVQAEDDSYKWEIHSVIEGEKVRHVVIDMVSQQWLTDEDIDQTEWRHWIVLTIPDGVTSEIGLMYIGGGSNLNTDPQPNPITTQIAMLTNTVVAEIGMIPNQPLVYKSDPQQRPRGEDDLIGYAWDKYLDSEDPRWLTRGPMVKSVVRGMDTVTAFSGSEEAQLDQPVAKFVVAGGSKRGWTAWLVAAMDTRVVAVSPIVIDVLSIRKSMNHHFAAYGFWAPSIGNYVEHGLMRNWDNPRLDKLYELVDPHSYIDRVKIPKLVLNAAGDQFFLPDSSQFYWDDLEGPKSLRYVANANHSLSQSNGFETLAAFHALVVNGKPMPEYHWSVTEEGEIRVTADSEPSEVVLWQATNPIARDFRVVSIGQAYTQTPLTADETGTYSGFVPEPEKGWTAYFVELAWDVGLPTPLRLSTEVVVTPNILPYQDKPSNLPNSITLICTVPSEQVKSALLQAIENLEDSSFAKEGIHTQEWGDRIYINWTPADLFQRGFFEMAGLLEASGCTSRNYHFESGPEITVPPLSPE